MFLHKIIKQSVKFNSVCRHLYSAPVYVNKDSFFEEIIKGVIYEDKNVLAINKPINISMHGLKDGIQNTKSSVDECYFSLADIKPELMKYSNSSELHECYSQNRLYSGLVVYAKDMQTRDGLQKYFRHVRSNKVDHQTYWTIGMNNKNLQSSGEKDIYFKKQSSLGFLVNSVAKKHRKSGNILTSHYKHRLMNCFTIDQNEFLSLVEIKPILTKWDALSLMMEDLGCSILGDHKYSYRWKRVLNQLVLSNHEPQNIDEDQITSQKLSVELSQKLGLKQHQQVPLHLHCRHIVIPRFNSKKKQIKLLAPIPSFFKDTLQCLKQ